MQTLPVVGRTALLGLPIAVQLADHQKQGEVQLDIGLQHHRV